MTTNTTDAAGTQPRHGEIRRYSDLANLPAQVGVPVALAVLFAASVWAKSFTPLQLDTSAIVLVAAAGAMSGGAAATLTAVLLFPIGHLPPLLAGELTPSEAMWCLAIYCLLVLTIIVANQRNNKSNKSLRAAMAQSVMCDFVEKSISDIAIFDTEMRCLAFSQSWKQNSKDKIGVCHYETFPDCPPHWREADRRALGGETIHSDGVECMVLPDGSRRWCNWEVRPWFKDGKIGGIIINYEDLTPEYRAEQAAKSAEELNRGILEAIPSQIAVLDRNGVILTANHAWLKSAEREASIFPAVGVGGNFLAALKNLQEAGEELHAGLLSVLSRTASDCHCTISVFSGARQLWHEAIAVPFGDGAGGAVLQVSDITKRKEAEIALVESEERLRRASQAAGFGIFDYEVAPKRMIGTEGLGQIFGRPAYEMTKDEAFAQLHPDDREGQLQLWRDNLKQVGPFTQTARIVRADGSVRHILARAESLGPISAENALARRVIGTVIDVTDLRLAQEALERSSRFELIAQLTGGITHDLNNLLTVVSTNLQLAAQSTDPAKTKRWIEASLAAVDRGASFHQRLLSLTHHSRVEGVILSANDRLNELADVLRSTLEANIRIDTDLAEDLWPVNAVPGELDGAILNIAMNSRDAMAEGGTIRLSTRNVVLNAKNRACDIDIPDGDYIRVTVRDTGCGMTAEQLRKAFQPFFTTKASGKGTGLGLASVQVFAKRAGGGVQLESSLGKGTKVSLYLPRAVPVSFPHDADSDTRLASNRTGNGEMILVVEDEPQLRVATCEMIETLGYRTVAAENAERAIEALESDPKIVAIVSDIVMTGKLTGYDLVRWQRTHVPAMPILLVTGYEPNSMVGASSGELLDIPLLTKPYSQKLLLDMLSKVLATRPGVRQQAAIS